MIDKNYVKRCTSDTFYYRGLQLYNANKVIEFNIEQDSVFEYINATVKGSGRNLYKVKLDTKDQNYFNYSYCECPAFRSYKGLCKHCVAVALEYIDVQKGQNIRTEFMTKQEESLRKLQQIQKGIKIQDAEQNMPQTTPQIKNLLFRYSQRKLLPLTESNVYGKISLNPYLILNDTDSNVEYKIGYDKMYILRDIFGFAKRMENKGDFSYGKQLTFKHIPEAFEPKSLPAAQFIKTWAKKNRSSYEKPMFINSYYTYDTPSVREMPLTNEDLEQFILSMGNREFDAMISGSRNHLWKVTEKN